MPDDLPTSVSALIISALVGVAVIGWLLRLERSGRQHVAFLLVLTIVLVDCLLFPSFGTTAGVLDLDVGAGTVSLAAAVAVAAVAVKLVVPHPHRPVSLVAGLWIAFLVWTTAAAAWGFADGHPTRTIFNELFVVIHIGVVGLLAADAPVDRLMGRTGVPRLANVFAPVALVLGILQLAEVEIDATLPLLSTVSLSRIGADAATALAVLGVLTLSVGLARETHRRGPLISGTVLVLATFVLDQRAAWLGTLVSLLVVALGIVVARPATDGRGLHARASESLLPLGVLGVITAGILLRTAAIGDADWFLSYFTDPFTSIGNQQSSRSRENQWSNALPLLAEHPVVGSGLGTTYRYVEEGRGLLVESNITHNIVLDVGIRSGLVGVALLAAATLAMLLAGRRLLRSDAAPAVKAAALGATAAFAGLMTKGMVESVFEKHRLAIMLGLCLGLTHAAWRAERSSSSPLPLEAAAQRLPGVHEHATRRSTATWT